MGWNLKQSYLDLPDLFYMKTTPQIGKSAKLVLFNDKLAGELGLAADLVKADPAILAGDVAETGVAAIAQSYAGHQFGHFTRLGDGRAVLVGEQETPSGEQFDIQLKGSGPTDYSRGGDGLASVGPMLREYIMSEAMHALGIPSTRALAVVTSEEAVYREEVLQRAILTRVAASHLRVGTFQFAAGIGSEVDLRALADYTIRRHDKDLAASKNKYAEFLKNVLDRQASLIAKWQSVGFVHGVMNTDNMTISGETIDYGPCAFLDTFNRKTVFSSIDRDGRYAYGNQPYIGAWNLTRLAEALLPILADEEAEAVEIAEAVLAKYEQVYQNYYEKEMRAKLGLMNAEPGDTTLIKRLLDLLEKYEADYTNTFLALTFAEDTMLHEQTDFLVWEKAWQKRRARQEATLEKSQKCMQAHNPAVIPRNHLVEEALEAAVGRNDYVKVKELLQVLNNPYAHTKEQQAYREVPELPEAYQTFCGT